MEFLHGAKSFSIPRSQRQKVIELKHETSLFHRDSTLLRLPRAEGSSRDLQLTRANQRPPKRFLGENLTASALGRVLGPL
jgi:hypothetical protein